MTNYITVHVTLALLDSTVQLLSSNRLVGMKENKNAERIQKIYIYIYMFFTVCFVGDEKAEELSVTYDYVLVIKN